MDILQNENNDQSAVEYDTNIGREEETKSQITNDPTFIDWYGNVALHHSVVTELPDITRIKDLLTKYPAGANVKNQFGRIPLHYALDRKSSKVSIEIVKLLLSVHPKGASEPDNDGNYYINCNIFVLFIIKNENRCHSI